MKKAVFRTLARTDLYFLLRYVLCRPDAERKWLFDRCKEVQESPDGHLDLWSREHYKSTIITFAKTVQDILATHGDGAVGQEVTVGIFSHTRPIAKGFLRQIKREFEANELLRELFRDIIWDNPYREAPKWSEDDGLVLKRKSNPKESTLEAHGLIDGQPTGKHFRLMVYDDVVTISSVSSPDMIAKTTSAWEVSRNLSAEGGASRYIGTRYHFNDTYRTLMERGIKERVYTATVDGTLEGEPVLLASGRLAEKRREMGPYTFACQMMQNPKADETQGFKHDWVLQDKIDSWANLNRYILVDPAGEKKKSSDYTAAWCVGLGPDGMYYVVDVMRDRLNLTERADLLFRWHQKYKPMGVGYEQYGLQADIQHIQDRQRRENYRFQITKLGGSMPKNDRIRRLIPVFEQKRLVLPESLYYVDYEGQSKELIGTFLRDEYDAFPVSPHDDMLDALSRIMDPDLNVRWPKPRKPNDGDAYQRKPRTKRNSTSRSWITA